MADICIPLENELPKQTQFSEKLGIWTHVKVFFKEMININVRIMLLLKIKAVEYSKNTCDVLDLKPSDG